ncbi:MAG: alkaline phosphatase [Parahaliea sp.]
MVQALGLSALILVLGACSDDDNDNKGGDTETPPATSDPITRLSASDLASNTENTWFIEGQSRVNAWDPQAIRTARGGARNVILFVGDGMGISTVTAARIYAGQKAGQSGEEYSLSFGQFPFTGLSKTYNVDAQTPDSAGTMSAMVTGLKTDAGVFGVDEDVERGNCSSVAGNEVLSFLDLAEIAGMATGIVSTARITHATPAATYAKSADRNWEDISDMPREAVDGGCEDIASQLINFESNLEQRVSGIDVDGIEVMMGGGRRHFLPNDAAANSPDAMSAIEGDRTDGRNLITEWQSRYPNGVYAYDSHGFAAIDSDSVERVLGLFNESHMQYAADRNNDIAGEPSLSEMTATAIDVLDKYEEGYFLMVEAGRIDHGHHAGNAFGALEDAVELSRAVAVAVDKTNVEDTLIIVTADHSHVMTIGGYPKRGNPILGKVVAVGASEPMLAADGMPYTTLSYANGLGYQNLGGETDSDAVYGHAYHSGRVDLGSVDTQAPGFHQEALVPMGSETHAGEDVGIYALGPGGHLVSGTNEQSIIFHVMEYATDLINRAESAL